MTEYNISECNDTFQLVLVANDMSAYAYIVSLTVMDTSTGESIRAMCVLASVLNSCYNK